MMKTRQIDNSISSTSGKPEEVLSPVTAYGRELEKNHLIPFHSHQRAQLIYASIGIMNVATHSATYVVPPQRAVWMPSTTEHSIEARSHVSMRTLYIDKNVLPKLADEVCVLQVSPLLKELIVEAVASAASYEEEIVQARLMAVILDQIGIQKKVSLALPLPTDPRLTAITQSLINNPADSRPLADWGKRVGASKRTIERLFMSQTGVSFQSWRQIRRLHRALELLASQTSVTDIALELGYENTSAFIAMFRRHLGTTPTSYSKLTK